MKSSEVSIKTWSTPASLTIQGQVTKDTTVKWSVHTHQTSLLLTCIHKSENDTRPKSNSLTFQCFI